MKIFIFNNAVPTEKGMSGSDRRALEYARHFAGKKYLVALVLPEIARRRYEGIEAGFFITDAAAENSRPSFSFLMHRIKGAFNACRNIKPSPGDVIYSSSDIIADSIPALRLKKQNRDTRLICGMHLIAPLPWKGFRHAFTGGWSVPGLKDIYYYFSQRYIRRELKKYADLILVSNSLDKKKLVLEGCRQDQVMVCFGAPDHELINKVPDQAKKFDAAYVGRYHEQKGFEDIMKIVQLVSRDKKDFKCAIVSDIPAARLQRDLDKYRIGANVEFFGFRDKADKYRIIKQSRLFFFPSFYESFGMAICEAMACGVGVVAYDLPIYADIYPEGILKAPIGDVKAFAGIVSGLLGNEGNMAELSRRALDISRRFSWEKTADDILKRIGK